MVDIRKLNHGRETYAVFYKDYVMKRPLPTFTDNTRREWLDKQHRTNDVINEIAAIGNPAYNIPRMYFVNDDEYSILEQRAPGKHLDGELFRKLSQRQKTEIIYGIASFLVDMNELKPVTNLENHKIISEINFDKLTRFVDTKMSVLFSRTDTLYMSRICHDIMQFEYPTRLAWSHGDLNPSNVLYDSDTSTLSFIDFAEADYKFIYRDIFASLQVELGIGKKVYEQYTKLHDNSKFLMPAASNTLITKIMKYRMIMVFLKRFIKASDDIHLNTQSAKGKRNNENKVVLMRDIIQQIQKLEQQTKPR